jgi:hypothetical protein
LGRDAKAHYVFRTESPNLGSAQQLVKGFRRSANIWYFSSGITMLIIISDVQPSAGGSIGSRDSVG